MDTLVTSIPAIAFTFAAVTGFTCSPAAALPLESLHRNDLSRGRDREAERMLTKFATGRRMMAAALTTLLGVITASTLYVTWRRSGSRGQMNDLVSGSD